MSTTIWHSPSRRINLWVSAPVHNRFNRWRKAGVWDRLMDAIVKAHDGDVQMIDTSVARVHQQARRQKGGSRSMSGSLARRWPHNQDPRARRQERPAPEAQTHGPAKERHRKRTRNDRRTAEGRHAARGQGLRRQWASRHGDCARGLGEHSTQVQPQRSPICFSKHLYASTERRPSYLAAVSRSSLF